MCRMCPPDCCWSSWSQAPPSICRYPQNTRSACRVLPCHGAVTPSAMCSGLAHPHPKFGMASGASCTLTVAMHPSVPLLQHPLLGETACATGTFNKLITCGHRFPGEDGMLCSRGAAGLPQDLSKITFFSSLPPKTPSFCSLRLSVPQSRVHALQGICALFNLKIY